MMGGGRGRVLAADAQRIAFEITYASRLTRLGSGILRA